MYSCIRVFCVFYNVHVGILLRKKNTHNFWLLTETHIGFKAVDQNNEI